MEVVGGDAIAERFAGHVADESRLAGSAEVLAFPLCEADVCEVLGRGEPVTASSGRTGIVGGAVPAGGIALSTERMDALSVEEVPGGGRVARCGPGVSLEGLAAELAAQSPRLFFPPDPTETTAQVGGSVAANASGARSFKWGPTRRYVRGLSVVLACGQVLDLRRGECAAGPDGFEVELCGGEVLAVPLPRVEMPAVKSAAGYYSAPDMDLVDLFVGSEGTLGIITETTLAVEEAPETTLSLLGFFPGEEAALDFVRALRGEAASETAPPPGLQAVEFFDGASLDLLREKRAEDGAESEIPELPAGARAAVLAEVGCAACEEEDALESLAVLLEEHGADSEQAWAGLEERERARLSAFRHALPEAVNSLIGRAQREHPGLTKVGTDMAVPAAALGEMMAAYREVLGGAGLRCVIFGHVGENHLHANVLPADMDEYARAKELYLELARTAVRLGGTVSAEHGIGKLKRAFLEVMYGAEGVEEMRRVKRALDPDGRLGPGTLFES
ncbi:MAG: FAD-binding oxidoreductase [Planctomycetota bacterium]|jgi:D-lactate dehydrogenase (cytochrome)